MSSPSAGIRSPRAPLVVGLLLLLWAMHWLPFLFPQSRLWGINHLLFAPLWARIVFGIGGLCLVLFAFSAFRDFANRWFAMVAEALFSEKPLARWLIVSLISVALFWFLRPSLFWLGDSYSVPVNIGNDIPTVFKWSEMGAIFIAHAVAQLFPQRGAEVGRLAYAVISVVSGGVTVFLLFTLARALTEDARQRLLVWCVLVFGGWLLLFFGYTENYPILWPFIIAYIYSSVLYLEKRAPLLIPAILLLLAVVIHLQALFIAPSLLVLLFARGRLAKFYHNNRTLVWAAIVVVFGAGIYNIVRLYTHSLEFMLAVIPLFKGRPPAADYSLFSLPHIFDCLNQLLLLSPLLILFVVASGKWKRPIFHSKADQFLGLSAIGGLIFLCTIDPKLGMGRDWDLFALAGFFPLIWLSLRAVPRIASGLYPAIAVTAVILVFPFLTSQLAEQSSLSRFEYLLNLDMSRARTGMHMLKEFYAENGQPKKADSLDSILRQSFPEYTLVPLAYSYLESGDFSNAHRLADSVFRVNPYSNEVLVLRGNILVQSRQFQRAISDFEMAASLGQYDARILTSLGSAYGHTRQTQKAFDCFKQALSLNSEHWEAYEGMAIIYFEVGKYDSSLVCIRKYIAEDGRKPESLMLAGYCAYNLGKNSLARGYFERYLSVAPNSSYRERVENTLATIQ
ncbi:MAG: tetratricopeptide repeat protein [Candidatus Zixiibacteriota bacterium]